MPKPTTRVGAGSTRVAPTTVAPTTVPPPLDSPPVHQPPRLGDLAFFNQHSGYGLFDETSGTQCSADVGSTDNGGASFATLLPVAVWGCGGSASVGALAFDDHGDGFAYGPGLVVTHDGGALWQDAAQPGAVLAVDALGFSVWMLESDCPLATPSTGCHLHLLESVDGGRTWVSSTAPEQATVNPGLTYSPTTGQTWLLRLSQSSAYLYANPVTNPNGDPDEAPLWFTSDGGRTWSEKWLPCAMDAQTASVSVSPDGTLFAVCAAQPSAGYQVKSTLRSIDEGTTWVTEFSCPFPDPGPTPACASLPLNSGYLGGIDAVSDSTVYLIGGRSSLLVTHDSGRTWQEVEPLIGGTDAGTSQVVFFNAADGVVVGQDGSNDEASTIWQTSDGGARWTSVVPATD